MTENFFISYNAADRGTAHWIAGVLRQAGHDAAVHEWELPAGGNIPLWMNDRLSSTNRLIAVISPHYIHAVYSSMEWSAKLWEDPGGGRGLVIPVIVQPVEKLPPLLAPLARVELLGCDSDEAERRLLAAIEARGPPSTPPAFPGLGARAIDRGETARPVFRPPYAFRNRYFMGRDDVLDQLRLALFEDHASPLVITGPMGIGKTALASEYAFRTSAAYRGAWTIGCESQLTIYAGFTTLSDELGLTPHDASFPEKVAAAKAILSRGDEEWPFLLILDNAEAPSNVAELVNFPNTHLIVTSRNPEWAGKARVLELEPLSPVHSASYLAARSGQTDDCIPDLAEALGWRPFALEHAAAYCSECQLPLQSYLDGHEERLAEDRPVQGADYPASLVASVLISIRRAERSSPVARSVLEALALCAAEPIPRTLLNQIGTGHGASAAEVDQLLGQLRRLALVKLTADTATIHRADRAVVRATSQTRRHASPRELLLALSKVFPKEPFERSDTWPVCVSLWPHVSALRDLRACFNDGNDRLLYCRLLNSAGGWLHATGQFDEAQSLLWEAVEFGSSSAERHQIELSTWLNDLALLLWEIGRSELARSPGRQALRLGRRKLGPNHHIVATRHNNLALIEEALGHFKIAELHYQMARKIREKCFGPESVPVANTLANLGDMLRELGRFGEAETVLSHALAAAEKNPKAIVRLYQTLSAVAALFSATGRRPQAVLLLQRAEALCASVQRDGHPALEKVRNRLAMAKQASA